MQSSKLLVHNRATVKLLFAGLMYLTRNVDWYSYGAGE
jgi:inner membrane protein involved in colicin E2 resistance